jgi:hypothetical protein
MGIKNDIGLTSITPFKEDDCWYFKLVYKYEDNKGKHTVVIPKASVPFTQKYTPLINNLEPFCDVSLHNHLYINCYGSMLLYESVCNLAIERGIKTPACFFDIITEYASREMTLDEIEKELGYKVKIINKEKAK